MTEMINLREPTPDPKGEFCLTPTAQEIHEALDACRTYGLLGLVVGAPGVGKTTAIMEYLARHETGNVRICRMTRSASRLQPGLVRLGEAMGGAVTPNMAASELYGVVLYFASYMGDERRPGLLILDEAQHLDDDMLEAVRDLYDEIREGGGALGVVLAGNQSLMDRLTPRGKRSRARDFSQFMGRIGVVTELIAPYEGDVQALCNHHGVEGKEAVALVQRVANLPGALQKVRNLLKVAREPGRDKITLKDLQGAARVVGIPSKKGGAA